MKKFLAIAAVAISIAASAGEVINITSIYPAGGGSGNLSSALVPELERSGYTVNVTFAKTCTDALAMIAADPTNHFMAANIADVFLADKSKDGEKCPAINKSPVEVEIFTALNSGPFRLCTSPGFKGDTIEKLVAMSATGKKIKIGSSSRIQIPFLNKALARVPGLNFVVLPYSGTNTVRPAVLSGDVDLFAGTTLAEEMMAKGSTCFAASDRSMAPSVPFIGDKINFKDLPELSSKNMLYSVPGKVSPGVTPAMIKALNSPEYKKVLTYIGLPNGGLADGVTAEDLKRQAILIDNNYISTKE